MKWLSDLCEIHSYQMYYFLYPHAAVKNPESKFAGSLFMCLNTKGCTGLKYRSCLLDIGSLPSILNMFFCPGTKSKDFSSSEDDSQSHYNVKHTVLKGFLPQ